MTGRTLTRVFKFYRPLPMSQFQELLAQAAASGIACPVFDMICCMSVLLREHVDMSGRLGFHPGTASRAGCKPVCCCSGCFTPCALLLLRAHCSDTRTILWAGAQTHVLGVLLIAAALSTLSGVVYMPCLSSHELPVFSVGRFADTAVTAQILDTSHWRAVLKVTSGCRQCTTQKPPLTYSCSVESCCS